MQHLMQRHTLRCTWLEQSVIGSNQVINTAVGAAPRMQSGHMHARYLAATAWDPSHAAQHTEPGSHAQPAPQALRCCLTYRRPPFQLVGGGGLTPYTLPWLRLRRRAPDGPDRCPGSGQGGISNTRGREGEIASLRQVREGLWRWPRALWRRRGLLQGTLFWCGSRGSCCRCALQRGGATHRKRNGCGA